MRERELKLDRGRGLRRDVTSLPMRERELKLSRSLILCLSFCRSPCGSVN